MRSSLSSRIEGKTVRITLPSFLELKTLARQLFNERLLKHHMKKSLSNNSLICRWRTRRVARRRRLWCVKSQNARLTKACAFCRCENSANRSKFKRRCCLGWTCVFSFLSPMTLSKLNTSKKLTHSWSNGLNFSKCRSYWFRRRWT